MGGGRFHLASVEFQLSQFVRMDVPCGITGHTEVLSCLFEALDVVLPDPNAVVFAERWVVDDGVDP